jgi:hypothetical protein
MSWRQSIISVLSDALRFIVTGCLMIDGILLAAFSVWFVGRFLLQVFRLLNRTWFGADW